MLSRLEIGRQGHKGVKQCDVSRQSSVKRPLKTNNVMYQDRVASKDP